MRSDLDEALVRDFPCLYRDRHGDTRETRMCDGFPADGWEPLIRRMSGRVEPFCVATDLRALQVKEKFGALRVYLKSSGPIPDEVRAAVGNAVGESRLTCEACGASRPPREPPSMRTLCADCATFAEEFARRRSKRTPADEEWLAQFRGESGRLLYVEDALRRWRSRAGARVFLDDVRDAPAGWTRVYTAHEAIALLEAGGVVEISLDHDLGDDEKFGTGHDVCVWIEEQVALHDFVPPRIAIHSANVVGRARMQQAIESIERLQRQLEPISDEKKPKIDSS